MDKATMIEYAKVWREKCPCASIWDVPQNFADLLFDEHLIPEETLKEYESEARELTMLEVQAHVRHWADLGATLSHTWSADTVSKVNTMLRDWKEFCETKKMPQRMQKFYDNLLVRALAFLSKPVATLFDL